jgi:hypothetical protein
MVQYARKIASETTNVSVRITLPENSVRRLSKRIHCAKRIRAIITERVEFHLKVRLTSVFARRASMAEIVKKISTIANLNRVRMVESVSMRLPDFRAIAVELDTLETCVKRTSMNALEIHVKTTAFALITTVATPASVDRDSVVIIASKLSMSVSHRHVSTVAHASRRKKVTLSAFVAKVFRENFVKIHLNAPIIVPMIRNVWMVGVFASKA